MERSNRHWLYLVSAMVDMALIVGSFIGASYFYLGTLNGFEVSQHYRWNGLSTELMTVYAFLAVCCYAAAHVYGDTYYGRRWRVARKVVVINGVALLAFGSVLYLVRFVDMSRMTLAIFYAASTALVILKDWLISAVLTHIRASGKYQTRVLIAGSGPSARKYARAVGKDRTRLEHVVGYVGAPCEDEDAYLGTHEGGVKDLACALDTQDIDQLVIALEPEEYTYTRQVMAVADKYGVAVQMVPFYSDLLPRNPAIETFHSVSVIDMRSTALDNVLNGALAEMSFFAAVFGLFGRGRTAKARALLERVGLAHKAGQRASSLSGGEKQRCAIARALMQGCEAILADEPVASLDPVHAENVLSLLKKLQREEGATVIMNSHNVEQARSYADRIVGLREGRVVFSGAPDELSSAALRDIYGDEIA